MASTSDKQKKIQDTITIWIFIVLIVFMLPGLVIVAILQCVYPILYPTNLYLAGAISVCMIAFFSVKSKSFISGLGIHLLISLFLFLSVLGLGLIGFSGPATALMNQIDEKAMNMQVK